MKTAFWPSKYKYDDMNVSSLPIKWYKAPSINYNNIFLHEDEHEEEEKRDKGGVRVIMAVRALNPKRGSISPISL